jgi:hypothetical protein
MWGYFITTRDAYYTYGEFLEGRSSTYVKGKLYKKQPHDNGRAWVNIDDPVYDRIAINWQDVEEVE